LAQDERLASLGDSTLSQSVETMRTCCALMEQVVGDVLGARRG